MNSTLLPLLPAVYDILFDFAQSDGFWANLETAFGTNYDVVKATQLRQQWQSRDFSQLPPITVKNLGNSGIFGAYSSSTNKIYISQALIDSGDATTLSAVLLEEIGHFIDAQINSSDTPGDEGQLFSALVRGEVLTGEQIAAIREENDAATITVDGQAISVEMAFSTPTNFSVGNFPISVTVGDFNGDGKSDLAVANLNGNNVSVLLGTGAGSFGPATNFSVGSSPISVTVGDFNGDGKSDLAVANRYGNNVSVLLGTGAGSFGPATNFSVGIRPYSVTVGDFNGDGKSDLATANFGRDNVSVLLGTGTGSFGAATNFTVGSRPYSVTVGDFNGDGKSDLAVANSNSSYVSVLLGTSTGSFGPATNFSVGLSAISVTVGDFNSDGKSDLAVAKRVSSNVSVLLGTGTGSFGNATNFTVGSSATSVTVGDFNGDGKSDLAVANWYSSYVSVLLGTGTGSFGPATNFTLGSRPYSARVGDFNGDGKSDLAVANAGSSYVSVILNADPTATVTITDPSISLTINDVTLTEGNSGTTNAVFTVSLSSAASTVVTVNYATANGTATAGTDYTAIPTTTLTFNPGETSKTITVPVNGDNQVELNETFFVNLSNLQGNGSNVTLADNQGQGTINNDDNPNQSPTDLTLSNNTVAENQPINTLIGDFTTTDPDTGNTFTYSLVSGTGDTDNSLFSISANQLKTNATFDYETKNSYSIRVKTTDQGGLSYEKPLTVNITDVGATLVSNYDTRHATDLHIVGNYAYVANWTGGWYSILKIIDISNPTNPILKGNYTSIHIAWDVQVVGNYAYVVSGDPATLQITDISNPANPTFKSAITFYQDVPNDVEVVGNLAYVACNVSGLHIIDISNPTNPIHKANYRTGDLYSGYALGVQVVNKYAYVAALDLGLQIIDISNPTAPTLKGKYDTPGIADDVQIVGNYAYVADRGSGLQIIDISNPSNPTLKGNYKTSYSAESVQVVDKYAYVAVGYLGLEIIDISNPANPTLKGNYDTDGWVSDVQVVGNYAYLADGDGGLKILDVSEFTTPVTSVTLAVSPSSVAEDGTTNLVYAFIRNGNTTNPLTVNYTVGGTATFNTDYTQSGAANFTSTTGTVTFAAGSSTATVTIDPTADTIVEADETVILTLISGTGYTLDAATTATGTINNDDSASIAISDVTVTEGNSGTTNAVFTVTLSNPVDTAITLNYATADGTATTADNDYIAIATTPLTFNAGETSKTITVAVNGDTKVESNETFFVNLSNLQTNGRNVTLADNQGQGTITNDDVILPSITLAVSPSSVTEDGTQNLIYTFTRSGVTTNLLTVNYSIGGTATNGTDYASIPTGVTFAANLATATVTINPTADKLLRI
ncbi:MAG: VCBS repeat-containing protein [Pseudanabaena sp. M114S2SP2A07QC]|jgi:hypothetical protein|uniref:FG-GAP-like repeat-containing protein n=1 Tax=unclassified Microcystis TaxID=2643300 RepID=UPI0025874912|nr:MULTISPECIES: FG-GAP-like repeat-containing protein [unclassified Microcystis]MCA2668070.1 VCBS repeat-containing protein [Microcystis sp. M045S2]MCA2836948.1 VCBS repeat-containing protein [Microcystis sp. M078S1]MCA6556351.1 VCBS repeat-containing protein [Pseudanabaena sp. M114S2SP2A07QC]